MVVNPRVGADVPAATGHLLIVCGVLLAVFFAVSCASKSDGAHPPGGGQGPDASLSGGTDAGGLGDGAQTSTDDAGSPPMGDAAAPDSAGSGTPTGDAGDAGTAANSPSGPRPCDIFGDAGTTCVGAHSTTRALYAAYSGKLYQVLRASDGTTADIGTLAPGGYANADAQDTFCNGTKCKIPKIYDQSPMGNDLTAALTGSNPSDSAADAAALRATAGGHRVYGIYVTPGTGYRNVNAVGTAKNGQPESAYMVTSGKHVNNGCCFDYGNTEQPVVKDTGQGHMDAVYFGLRCEHPPCTGNGPWIAADLENGLFQGNGSNTNNLPVTFDLVTAMLKNDGQKQFALKTGNAESGGLTTQYAGTLPTSGGYIPMHQEGGIVLGVGGDNSSGSAGDFYEGVMTAGYPSDAAQDAVQADIVSVGYMTSQSMPVVPTSENAPVNWKYTTASPPSSWNTLSFDDSSWTTGAGGFGTTITPGAIVGTTWNTGDIWIRQTFKPGSLSAAQIGSLVLRIDHDEGAEVYVNGVLAASFTGYLTGYEFDAMSAASQNAVTPNGNNVLAAHCHNTAAGQYIDVGIYE